MATVAHCLYCFETLAAKLENRPPMTLEEVEESWDEYPKGVEDESDEEEKEEASNAPAGATKPDFRANLSSTAVSSAGSSSKTPSSASSKPSTPLSTTTSAPPSRPPTSASIAREPAFHPVGQSKRSQQHLAITSSPLFVTWNKVSRRSQNRSLRGCIGTFESQDLDVGLKDYALTSALHDSRFSPITLAELPTLEAAVTLLTDFETCTDPLAWELGVHGIKISFYERHRRYTATYLPDVAVEQEWTKEETLESLIRKAGLTGRKKWRDVGELQVVRYQGRKESVEYQEYRRWREWVVSEEERKKKEKEKEKK